MDETEAKHEKNVREYSPRQYPKMRPIGIHEWSHRQISEIREIRIGSLSRVEIGYIEGENLLPLLGIKNKTAFNQKKNLAKAFS